MYACTGLLTYATDHRRRLTALRSSATPGRVDDDEPGLCGPSIGAVLDGAPGVADAGNSGRSRGAAPQPTGIFPFLCTGGLPG